MEPETIIKQALGDRYEIHSVIGKGGMATVYKAIQTSLNRPVALKVVHQNLVHDDEFIFRFLREAQVCASLNHPNIVTIYDVGSVGTVHYISMEYLEGMTLRELIKHKKYLTAEETAKYAIPIAEVLGYIHSHGIIHRDVKSSNIFITKAGRAVLMDFGIVFSEEQDPLSHDGTILGTPEYMSPEQAEGKIKIDGRSDIYSLGVILFECLTGNLPFHSDNYLSTLHHILHDSPPTVTSVNAQVPKWISSIVAGCLVKERSFRVKDGASLANFLRNREKIKVPTPVQESFTRKVKPGDIDKDQDDISPKDIPGKTSRNTILISIIISIAIIILILGIFTLAPSPVSSGTNTQIQAIRPVVTIPKNNQITSQNLKPALKTENPSAVSSSDPEKEKKDAIDQKISIGDQLLANNAFDSAINKYQEVLSIDPSNTRAKDKINSARAKWIQSIINMGDSQVFEKKYDNALSTYYKASRIDPSNNDLNQKIRNTKNEYIKSIILRGELNLRNGNYNEAIQIYETGKQIDSSNLNLQQKIIEAKKAYSQSFIKQADEQVKTHEYDLAISNYNSARKIDPGNKTISIKIAHVETEKQIFEKQTIEADLRVQNEKMLRNLGIIMIRVENQAAQNFYLEDSEVPQSLWKTIMGSNPSSSKGDMLPVENVSYNDIMDFLRTLNQTTRMNFRLPTEAEWEFAAKGGTNGHNFKYSGSNVISEVGWYINNSGKSIHTIRSLKGNELGFYDMSGNVWEYCNTSSGQDFLIKGGSWLSPNNSCTISGYDKIGADKKDYTTGFRLCRTE